MIGKEEEKEMKDYSLFLEYISSEAAENEGPNKLTALKGYPYVGKNNAGKQQNLTVKEKQNEQEC